MKRMDATFRDKLAYDRTLLAEERTMLAYLRSGLALIGLAFLMVKFFPSDLVTPLMFMLTLIVGSFMTSYGLIKIVSSHGRRTSFEDHYINWGE